jgi:hypothetical protein
MSDLIKNIFEIKKSKPYIDYNKYHRGNGITVYYCNDGFYVLDDPAETKYDLDGIVKHLTTS